MRAGRNTVTSYITEQMIVAINADKLWRKKKQGDEKYTIVPAVSFLRAKYTTVGGIGLHYLLLLEALLFMLSGRVEE